MKLKSLCLLCLACMLVVGVVPAKAQYIATVTPDEFMPQTWGSNLLSSTVDAFPGDNSNGYYYTDNYGNSPSATMIIPLPPGMPSGWNDYNIYEWNPAPANSQQWHVVDIAGDGTMNNDPTMPWAGQFGTNHQYLQNPQPTATGWVELGPGPQSDPTNDGGYGVWMNPSTGNGYPYLQIHYLGFENTPESFDAFRIVPVGTPVPEPGTLALLAASGVAVLLLARRRRQA